MKKFLNLRVPVWIMVVILVLGLGSIALKISADIGDYWDIGPWSVDSSGNLTNDDGGNIITFFPYKTVTLEVDTLTVTDCGFVEIANATCTVKLPTAVGNTGAWYSIKHTTTTTGVCTITTLINSQTIDGNAVNGNIDLDTQYDSLGVYSNGTNWLIWERRIQ